VEAAKSKAMRPSVCPILLCSALLTFSFWDWKI